MDNEITHAVGWDHGLHLAAVGFVQCMLSALLFLVVANVPTQPSDPPSFHFQRGAIALGSNLARLQVPEGFAYLSPQETEFFLVPLITAIVGQGVWGWASAPYDTTWANRHPRRAAWMALAGPAANLALFLLAALLMRAGMAAGVFRLASHPGWGHVVFGATNDWGFAAMVLSSIFTLNIILTVFNLFPFPPLDGSQAITLVMPLAAAERFHAFMAVGGSTRMIFVIALLRIMGPFSSWLQGRAVELFFS